LRRSDGSYQLKNAENDGGFEQKGESSPAPIGAAGKLYGSDVIEDF